MLLTCGLVHPVSPSIDVGGWFLVPARCLMSHLTTSL
jgi:hypothetical protein